MKLSPKVHFLNAEGGKEANDVCGGFNLAAPIRIMNRDEVREMWNKRQVFLEEFVERSIKCLLFKMGLFTNAYNSVTKFYPRLPELISCRNRGTSGYWSCSFVHTSTDSA